MLTVSLRILFKEVSVNNKKVSMKALTKFVHNELHLNFAQENVAVKWLGGVNGVASPVLELYTCKIPSTELTANLLEVPKSEQLPKLYMFLIFSTKHTVK